ncbi:MAG: hypothetical protein AAFR21_07920 [Pseudomonadota bacterium]
MTEKAACVAGQRGQKIARLRAHIGRLERAHARTAFSSGDQGSGPNGSIVESAALVAKGQGGSQWRGLPANAASLSRGHQQTISLWPGVQARAGTLHEVRAGDWRDFPSAVGFALGLMSRLGGGIHGEDPLFQHKERHAVALIEKAHEANGDGTFSARGMMALGIDPSGILFVRTRDDTKALWAAEEVLRAGGIALLALRKPAKQLDLKATRRLHLAATASGGFPIIVRCLEEGVGAETCAPFRWRVLPAPSSPPLYDHKSPGNPSFSIRLEKGTGDLSRLYHVEWKAHEQSFVECRRFLQSGERPGSGGQNTKPPLIAPGVGPLVSIPVHRSSSAA